LPKIAATSCCNWLAPKPKPRLFTQGFHVPAGMIIVRCFSSKVRRKIGDSQAWQHKSLVINAFPFFVGAWVLTEASGFVIYSYLPSFAQSTNCIIASNTTSFVQENFQVIETHLKCQSYLSSERWTGLLVAST
jgi:hypothetical protein